MAKTQGTIDRYFEAFEAGTLKAELCNEKVRNLRTRMEELEGEKRSLKARRERLELPAIDKEMLKSLLDNFEKVMGRRAEPTVAPGHPWPPRHAAIHGSKKEAPSPPGGEEGAYP